MAANVGRKTEANLTAGRIPALRVPTQMDLKLDHPRHGWLPVSLTISGKLCQFRASNVVNDPLSKFLAVALWLAAPDEPLPEIPSSLNPPFTETDVRCIHFWLEPVWHTLLVQRLPTRVRLVFYEDHPGALSVGPHDLRGSARTLFDRTSVSQFATTLYTSLASIRHGMAPALYDQHWGRPFSEAHLKSLATSLQRD